MRVHNFHFSLWCNVTLQVSDQRQYVDNRVFNDNRIYNYNTGGGGDNNGGGDDESKLPPSLKRAVQSTPTPLSSSSSSSSSSLPRSRGAFNFNADDAKDDSDDGIGNTNGNVNGNREGALPLPRPGTPTAHGSDCLAESVTLHWVSVIFIQSLFLFYLSVRVICPQTALSTPLSFAIFLMSLHFYCTFV
jgi:hypothetical protein